MNKLHLIINEGLVSQQLQGLQVTPSIIAQCIQQFKKAKETGTMVSLFNAIGKVFDYPILLLFNTCL